MATGETRSAGLTPASVSDLADLVPSWRLSLEAENKSPGRSRATPTRRPSSPPSCRVAGCRPTLALSPESTSRRSSCTCVTPARPRPPRPVTEGSSGASRGSRKRARSLARRSSDSPTEGLRAARGRAELGGPAGTARRLHDERLRRSARHRDRAPARRGGKRGHGAMRLPAGHRRQLRMGGRRDRSAARKAGPILGPDRHEAFVATRANARNPSTISPASA